MGWMTTSSELIRRGTSILGSCGSLHGLAKNAYERTKQAPSERSPGQHDALSAIVLSVVSLEAFIGELVEFVRVVFPAPADAERKRGRALVSMLDLVEEKREQIALKFQLTKFILTGTPYDTGTKPYQDFDLLLSVRNGLIHPKPFVIKPSEPGTPVDPLHKFREKCRSLNILAELPKTDAVAPLSTLIETKAAARWACNTAAEMVHSIFEAPSDDVLVGTLKSMFGNQFVKVPD
jgi:hypothetical protein